MGMTAAEKKAYKKGFSAGEESVEEGLPGWFGTFAKASRQAPIL